MFQDPEKNEQLRTVGAEIKAWVQHRVDRAVSNIESANIEAGIEGDDKDIAAVQAIGNTPENTYPESATSQAQVINMAEYRAKQLARSAVETDLTAHSEDTVSAAILTMPAARLNPVEQKAQELIDAA